MKSCPGGTFIPQKNQCGSPSRYRLVLEHSYGKSTCFNHTVNNHQYTGHGFAMPKITRGYIMTDLQSFWKEIQSPKSQPSRPQQKPRPWKRRQKPLEKRTYILCIYILYIYTTSLQSGGKELLSLIKFDKTYL